MFSYNYAAMYVCTATRDQLILCTDCYVLLSKCYFELNIEDNLKPKFNIKNVFHVTVY